MKYKWRIVGTLMILLGYAMVCDGWLTGFIMGPLGVVVGLIEHEEQKKQEEQNG